MPAWVLELLTAASVASFHVDDLPDHWVDELKVGLSD